MRAKPVSESVGIDSGSVYDFTDGANAPSVDADWDSDADNTGYSHHFKDQDFYKINLMESASTMDFVNITITVDYGSDHGAGARSWKDFGITAGLWRGTSNDVYRLLYNEFYAERHVFYGEPQYGNNFLDSWTDSSGMQHSSIHFNAHTDTSYLLCENVTDMTFTRTPAVDPVRNVMISMTVIAGDVEKTVSTAAVIRRNME